MKSQYFLKTEQDRFDANFLLFNKILFWKLSIWHRQIKNPTNDIVMQLPSANVVD